jgi:hypothetical protein
MGFLSKGSRPVAHGLLFVSGSAESPKRDFARTIVRPEWIGIRVRFRRARKLDRRISESWTWRGLS